MSATYRPKRGDLIWLNFTPQAGHEQAGRRPALVISDDDYNRMVGLILACPVTSRVKGYPFEVLLPGGMAIAGVVLANQVLEALIGRPARPSSSGKRRRGFDGNVGKIERVDRHRGRLSPLTWKQALICQCRIG